MAQADTAVRIGTWLFKYRSYLFVPLLVVLLVLTKPGATVGWGMITIADVLGVFVALCGYALRVAVIAYKKPGTSGRGTNIDVRELVTDGAYQVCRNPLYLGNFLIWMGLVIMRWNLIFLAAIVVFFAVEYYFIIRAEESYLSQTFGKAYDDFRNSVPAFLPRLFAFRKPNRPFNMHKVIKAESALLLLVLVTPALLKVHDYARRGELTREMAAVLLADIVGMAALWRIVYRANEMRSEARKQP
jgi:protein-S-isoprenylcysteine O-methyltransferase Ste14